ncbi:hypothetical protein EDB80DRAFT_590173 [Ilyonectria destructans]|nr:hypothetical protein EDB80DRAFT_590173 [Ilyonectria destructans]
MTLVDHRNIDSAVGTMCPEEKRLYGRLFREADTADLGVITGEAGVKFFENTKLPALTLGEIWQIPDVENRGFLTPSGFCIALRLIGHTQAGREPTVDLAFQPGPYPRFDGSSSPPLSILEAQQTGNPIQVPHLSLQEVTKYVGLFEKMLLQDGTYLPESAAKELFKKSKLSDETLERVWRLADSEGRGLLSRTEFIIAIHLLTSMKTESIQALPNVVPAKLYEAAIQGVSANNSSNDDLVKTGDDIWAISPSQRVL